jgi:molecular chaperone GrpE (heat shock protein)
MQKSLLLIFVAFAITIAATTPSSAQPQSSKSNDYARQQAEAERYQKLSERLESLEEAYLAQQKKMDKLRKDLGARIDQTANAGEGKYVTQSQLEKLAGNVKKLDEHRITDRKEVIKSIDDLRKSLIAIMKGAPATEIAEAPKPQKLDPSKFEKDTYEYEVQSRDNLTRIVGAYNEELFIPKGHRISLGDVRAANPGMDPNKIAPGDIIRIPIPK